MYTSYKRQKKHRVFLKFITIVTPILFLAGAIMWFLLVRNDSSSSSFSKVGAEIAYVKPATKVISTELFSVTLPTSWELLGKQNPYSNQVYYEFQNKQKNYDNRWLRIYVDIFPPDFAINRLLPITKINNKLTPGTLSEECSSFTGAPLPGSTNQSNYQTWAAKWQEIDFTCDMARSINYVGSASVDEGYGVTLLSSNGTTHKYFFVYIDHNVRPDYSLISDAVSSFVPL